MPPAVPRAPGRSARPPADRVTRGDLLARGAEVPACGIDVADEPSALDLPVLGAQHRLDAGRHRRTRRHRPGLAGLERAAVGWIARHDRFAEAPGPGSAHGPAVHGRSGICRDGRGGDRVVRERSADRVGERDRLGSDRLRASVGVRDAAGRPPVEVAHGGPSGHDSAADSAVPDSAVPDSAASRRAMAIAAARSSDEPPWSAAA